MEAPAPRTIAIVEDHAGLRRALRRMLAANGFRVEGYSSGTRYLSASAPLPDCLVLDLHLGDMSGFELEAGLREAGRLPPVLFITAHEALAARAIRQGRLCLVKPFDEAELLEALDRLSPPRP